MNEEQFELIQKLLPKRLYRFSVFYIIDESSSSVSGPYVSKSAAEKDMELIIDNYPEFNGLLGVVEMETVGDLDE